MFKDKIFLRGPMWIGLFLLYSSVLSNSVQLIDRMVAAVNGEIITQKQLEQEIFLAKKEWGIENEKGLREVVLQRMIEEQLLQQEAKKQGITVNSQMVEMAFFDVKKHLSEEEFKEILKKRNLSREEFRRRLREQLIRERLISQKIGELDKEIKIEEEEIGDFYLELRNYLEGGHEIREAVKEFYQKHQTKLAKASKVKIALIVVARKDIAQDILQQLREGEEFPILAQRFSLGPQAKEGGDLGWISFPEIKPSLRREILALKKGEINKIKETGDGFYFIIQLKDKREPSLAEFKDDIKGYLKERMREKALRKWMEQLKSRAEIKIILNQETGISDQGEEKSVF